MPDLKYKNAQTPREKLTFLKAIVQYGIEEAVDDVDEIDIENYDITADDVDVIALAAQKCHRLKKLRLKKCGIYAETSDTLWRRLEASKTKLNTLNYSDNVLIGKTLPFARNLVAVGGKLILQRCSLSSDDLSILATAMNNKNLALLDLSGNELSYSDLSSLGTVVKPGGEVITRNCGINTPGLQRLDVIRKTSASLQSDSQALEIMPFQSHISGDCQPIIGSFESRHLETESTGASSSDSDASMVYVQTVHSDSYTPGIYSTGFRARRTQRKKAPTVFEANNPMKHVLFKVDMNGAIVSTPYAKVNFPQSAVVRPIEIEMWADYSTYDRQNEYSDDEFPVSPKLVFKSNGNMIFKKSVTIELDVNYSAPDNKTPLVLRIKRTSKGTTTTVKVLGETFGRRVSFDVREFCSFRAVTKREQASRAKKHLCSAIILSRPETEHPNQHTISWHISDYHQDFVDIIKTECGQPYNKVLKSLENFSVRSSEAGTPIALSMFHKSLQFNPSSRDFMVHVDEPMQRNFSFTVERRLEEGENMQNRFEALKYEILQGNEERMQRNCLEGDFPLDWNTQPYRPGVNVTAKGQHATGMIIHMSDPR